MAAMLPPCAAARAAPTASGTSSRTDGRHCSCRGCGRLSALLGHVASDPTAGAPRAVGAATAAARSGGAWERWRALSARLEAGERLVLDGGMGTEVERIVGPAAVSAAGWSCTQNTAHPSAVKAAHAGFLDAGADIIIANTYATNRHILAAAGFEELTERANRLGARLALEARDEWCAAHPGAPRPLVAGSVSCHAPGDEIDKMEGRMAWPAPAQEVANYREQAALLAEEGVDLIFTEMVRDREHGMRVAAALDDSAVPVFMGLCVRGNLTMELSIRGTAKRAVRQTRPLVSFLPRAGHTVHSVRLFALLLVECRTAWTTPGRCQVRKRSLSRPLFMLK